MANPLVGGAEMFPTKTIVENASAAGNLTTLVAAVKAAGLVDTLNGTQELTVFAPVNTAFDRLPAGTVDNLLKPENKDALVKLLTFHVLPGKMTGAMLMEKIKAGGGEAMVTTVAGMPLKLTVVSGDIAITDGLGGTSYVQQADVMQKNGVVHTVNGVLLPKN
ncbi:MAG: fasciclin domain-containing protein [Parasphingorhabdus sp.]|nr:fasciclin domain-containing protein [Parasphingorhabdus sp.]